jgi:hypothetical protein
MAGTIVTQGLLDKKSHRHIFSMIINLPVILYC